MEQNIDSGTNECGSFIMYLFCTCHTTLIGCYCLGLNVRVRVNLLAGSQSTSFNSGAEWHVFQSVWRICFWSGEKHAPPLFISCRAAVAAVLPGHLEPVCIYCSVLVT